jgi:hypothetical protein
MHTGVHLLTVAGQQHNLTWLGWGDQRWWHGGRLLDRLQLRLDRMDGLLHSASCWTDCTEGTGLSSSSGMFAYRWLSGIWEHHS